MILEGDIILFRFPHTDMTQGKLRPALVLKKLPGQFNDWLICMISSRTHLYHTEFDEVITTASNDFTESGLKTSSVIRICRIAVVEGEIFVGKLGAISSQRLKKIKTKLSKWIMS